MDCRQTSPAASGAVESLPMVTVYDVVPCQLETPRDRDSGLSNARRTADACSGSIPIDAPFPHPPRVRRPKTLALSGEQARRVNRRDASVDVTDAGLLSCP